MGDDVAAIDRPNVDGDAVISVGLNPDLVMRRMARGIFLAVANRADEDTVAALLGRRLGTRMGHRAFVLETCQADPNARTPVP